jgi:hypothetical protein
LPKKTAESTFKLKLEEKVWVGCKDVKMPNITVVQKVEPGTVVRCMLIRGYDAFNFCLL